MKYSIEGIEKAKTIKSTQIINKKGSNKAIIVNYLDGTQDVFELNDDNVKNIKEIAEMQGKKFAQSGLKKIKIGVITMTVNLFFFILSMIINVVAFPTYGLVPLGVIISAILGVMTVVSFTDVSIKKNYVDKYQLYFEQIKDKLNDYKEILEKEKQLTNQKSNDQFKLDSVLDLDNVSLKQVESINGKVDRYREIEKTKVKKIENPSLY